MEEKMKYFALILMLIVAIISSSTNAQEIKKSISQRTLPIYKISKNNTLEPESDTVELSDLFEPDFPSFTTITIYRNNKKIFSFHDPKGEFYDDKGLFTEHKSLHGKESYLIFSCSGRPSADYYFVLHKSESGYTQLGYTASITAEIFGDIDHDGVFEIGGFENMDEVGNTIDESIRIATKQYKIYKVLPNFPLDKTLMDAIRPIVIDNYRKYFLSSEEPKK
jgi:hypothetical protein